MNKSSVSGKEAFLQKAIAKFGSNAEFKNNDMIEFAKSLRIKKADWNWIFVKEFKVAYGTYRLPDAVPVLSAPVKTAPSKSASVKTAPSKSASVKTAPSKVTPDIRSNAAAFVAFRNEAAAINP